MPKPFDTLTSMRLCALEFAPLPQLIYDPLAILKPALTAAAPSDTAAHSETAKESADDHQSRPTTSAHFWVQQRQNDTIFLLPKALAGPRDAVAVDPGVVNDERGVFVTLSPGEAGGEDEGDEGVGFGGVGAPSGREVRDTFYT